MTTDDALTMLANAIATIVKLEKQIKYLEAQQQVLLKRIEELEGV